MLFRVPFRRWLLRILLAVVLVLCLKLLLPGPGRTVGAWIAGCAENRVSAAIECFVASLSDGDSLHDAAEVSYEVWQTFAAN